MDKKIKKYLERQRDSIIAEVEVRGDIFENEIYMLVALKALGIRVKHFIFKGDKNERRL